MSMEGGGGGEGEGMGGKGRVWRGGCNQLKLWGLVSTPRAAVEDKE